MQPFSTSEDFRDALGVFISQFTGGSPGPVQLTLASVNVLSYGAGFAVEQFGNATFAGLSADMPEELSQDKALAACNQAMSVLKAPRGADASAIPWDKIPWATLFQIALSFLKQYLPAWVTIPVPPSPPVR